MLSTPPSGSSCVPIQIVIYNKSHARVRVRINQIKSYRSVDSTQLTITFCLACSACQFISCSFHALSLFLLIFIICYFRALERRFSVCAAGTLEAASLACEAAWTSLQPSAERGLAKIADAKCRLASASPHARLAPCWLV
jgi:hypothetical protein